MYTHDLNKILKLKDWCYEELCCDSDITWEIVRDNPDFPWYYEYLSMNPNITYEIVRDNPELPWNYYWLTYPHFKSCNPNDDCSDEEMKRIYYCQSMYKLQKKKHQELLEELYEKFGIPPNVDKRPIFSKGGVWFWEDWEEIQELNKSS